MNGPSETNTDRAGFGAGGRRTLRRSGLLDGNGNGTFGRLADMTKAVLSVPMVLITLCDGDGQVIAAQRGLASPLDREGAALPARSFGAQVLRKGRSFMTGEARADRPAPDLAGEDSRIRAYLGVPLKLPSGEIVGVVAAADKVPRRWSEAEIGHMHSAASILGEEIATRLSETKWRTLFEDMQESFYVAEAIRDAAGRMVDFRYLDVNPAFERLPGRRGAVGRTVREILPEVAGQLVADYRSVVEDGTPKLVESLTEGEWYEVRARRIDVDRFAVIFHNISERKHAEIRLAEIEERRRLAIETGEVGILDLDLEARSVEWDERGAAFHGLVGRTKVDFDEIARALHPADRAELRLQVKQVLADGARSLGLQYRLTGIDDGKTRWLFMNATATRDASGRPRRLIGAVRDISDRVEAEERRALLNAELSHRLKNTLAIVSSIITQTLRSATDIPSARKALSDRIQALSKTHDILLSGQRDAASMEAVVAAALAVHDEERRVVVEGPRLAIGPKASLSLSLIVHELATNAGKYGALSVPEGRVEASWSVCEAPGGGTPILVFRWSETNGPEVAAPLRKGFGTRLIEMGLSGSADASTRLTYGAQGFDCRIVAPLSEITASDEPLL